MRFWQAVQTLLRPEEAAATEARAPIQKSLDVAGRGRCPRARRVRVFPDVRRSIYGPGHYRRGFFRAEPVAKEGRAAGGQSGALPMWLCNDARAVCGHRQHLSAPHQEHRTNPGNGAGE